MQETLQILDQLLEDCAREVNRMPGTQDMVLASKAKELYSAVMKAYRVCGETEAGKTLDAIELDIAQDLV